MVIFIDESGDTGRKTDKGSSEFFVISMVSFIDLDEANRCDKAIDELRNRINLPSDFEFHYSRNSDRVRKAFLEEIRRFKFEARTLAINKDPRVLYGEGFKNKKSFYKFSCRILLEGSKNIINNAIIVIDKSDSKVFQKELKKYLNNRLSEEARMIKKIKQDASHKNNLLQVADYFASISARKVRGKSINHYEYISKKNYIQIWPKNN